MSCLRLLAVCTLLPLSGCLRYVVAAPADPVKALKSPVYLEDMARVPKSDSGLIRFVLRVTAPRDTAILLLLGDQAPQRLTVDRGRPAIQLRLRNAESDSAARLQARLVDWSNQVEGGARAEVVPAGTTRRVSVFLVPVYQLPPEFAIDLSWYMHPFADTPRAETQLIERGEYESRIGRMNSVPVGPVLAAAALSVYGFFRLTIRR